MSNVENAVDNMISAIKESQVYGEYKKQLTVIKQQPDLKQQVDEFRACNFEFQNSAECAFEKLEEFERKYESLREQPLVSDFLAAELAFCRMMQELNNQITEALDFE